ncbi:MAG: PaaI family thioesterase [Bacteroidia bacterium]
MFYNYKNITLDALNKRLQNTLATHLGMEVTELGNHYLIMKMPVDERTIQPLGLLNGGASMALAETVGSLAANISVNDNLACVGLDINGNHIKSARSGYVYGKAVPLHLGNRTHVWEIKITDDDENLICIARLTVAVIDRPK